MKKLIDVEVKKLAHTNSFFGVVEVETVRGVCFDTAEFHAETLRELWDKVTFFLLDFEEVVESYIV